MKDIVSRDLVSFGLSKEKDKVEIHGSPQALRNFSSLILKLAEDGMGDAHLITATKFALHNFDPENELYYMNARYYDPLIGSFTTADTYIDGEDSFMGFNRYAYVHGNPIKYNDPTGHFFKALWNGFKKVVSAVVGFVVAAVAAPAVAIYSGITGTNFKDNLTDVQNFGKDIGRGIANVVGAAIALPVALNPLVTGLVGGFASLARGKSFLSGFGKGFVASLGNLGLAMATFGVSIGLSLGNAFLGGYYDIYSNDDQGMAAFWLDHTVGQGTTAIGTVALIADIIGGGKLEGDLSRGSNAFVISGSAFSNRKGYSVGNVAGTVYKPGDRDFNRTMREELFHNWQYRYGGVLNLGRLVYEFVLNETGSVDTYNTPGYLEHEAKNRSNRSFEARPWELRCSGCSKFYLESHYVASFI